MLVNLNDAESILTWWKVLPERHDVFLDYKLRASPEFAPAILEARRQIANNPELRRLLRDSIQRRNDTVQQEHLSAHELRHREFAMA